MADLGEQTITDRRTGAVRLRSARTVALVGFLAAPRRVSADPAHADSAGGRDAGRGCSRGSARCWIRTARRPVSGAQPAPGRVAGRCRGAAQHGACPCGAGVGKSRLVAEVAEMARLQGAIVASTQCFATSGRLALAPVADWLRNPAVRSAASAGGFPLYVIEAVRSSDDLSAGMPVGDLTTVLRNRLGQVSAAAREVAGLAAAVGTDFTLDLLTEASDLDADTVVGAIDELWRRRRRSTPGPATPHPSCSRPLSARSSWRNHWAARTRRSPAWSRSGHRSSCKGEPPTATRPRPGR